MAETSSLLRSRTHYAYRGFESLPLRSFLLKTYLYFFNLQFIMAVPKKRKSKSKTKIRKAVWKKKAQQEAAKSIALSKALLKENPTRFIYND